METWTQCRDSVMFQPWFSVSVKLACRYALQKKHATHAVKNDKIFKHACWNNAPNKMEWAYLG